MSADWFFDPLPPLMADLIMIDPPWRHELRSQKGYTEKSASGQYDTMPIEEIRALPVGALARGDAILWCWATHAMIDQQIACVRAWGFKFSTTGVWVKRTKRGKLNFGTGQRLRCASEPFIIASFDAPITERSVRTVIDGPIREHSRKPDEAYQAAEKLYPRALCRMDIFSRETRPGWRSWGREAGKFDNDERVA